MHNNMSQKSGRVGALVNLFRGCGVLDVRCAGPGVEYCSTESYPGENSPLCNYWTSLQL